PKQTRLLIISLELLLQYTTAAATIKPVSTERHYDEINQVDPWTRSGRILGSPKFMNHRLTAYLGSITECAPVCSVPCVTAHCRVSRSGPAQLSKRPPPASADEITPHREPSRPKSGS
ncbi:uncharacterized protein PgNI_02906, partial [Pyricularia grisea]|uniref:Secreted protein n=1 Tax=Pyricularia grisea TaxID=148305 RepID=A0A6P8B9J1_PYRGI